MSKHVWAWAIGSALFVAIVGLWLWQLPNILARAGKGRDIGLSGIVSSLGTAKTQMGPDLEKLQKQLDQNMKSIDQSMKTQAAQATVIGDLKNKLENTNSNVR